MHPCPIDLFVSPHDAEKSAFICNQTPLSFGAFCKDVAAYAAYFKTLRDEKVILFVEEPYLFAVCFFGLLQAQKEVILTPFLNQGAGAYLKEITQTVVTSAPFVHEDMHIHSVPMDLPSADWTFVPLSGRFVSFFTSGSTSTPKQIRKAFETLNAEVMFHLQNHPAFFKDPVLIASIQPFHMYGMLWRLLIPLCAGVPIDADVLYSPEELKQKMETYSSVIFVSTPSFMDKLIKYQHQYDFPQTCVEVISSGSLLREETSAGMHALFKVSPFEVFGSTETGGVAGRRQIKGPFWHLFNEVQTELDADNKLRISSAFCVQNPFQMQDAVQMTAKDTFLLKGRLDRLVKIAEKRVSLPEMEERYAAHPFVERAHLILLDSERPQLGAVLTLTASGKTFLKQHSKKALLALLTTYLNGFFEPGTLPKKTRFVFEIPTNPQGKYTKELILPLFDNNLAEPVLEDVTFSAEKWSARLTFLPDALYFQGHFPDFPILPGVVQVHFAALFRKRFLRQEGWIELQKLKFSNLIFPADTVDLTLEKISPTQTLFTYQKDGKVCSSGIFKKEAPDV